MDKELRVTLTQTHDQRPLASLHNLPGPDADLTPTQLRALAAALLAVAQDSEARAMDRKHFMRQVRGYTLEVVPGVAADAGKLRR